MKTSDRLINQLPPVVKVQIASSISWLKVALDVLRQARRADAMFSGQGRYEAEVLENRYRSIEAFGAERDRKFAVIQHWQDYALTNGMEFNFALMLQQEGCPALEDLFVSKPAAEYFAN